MAENEVLSADEPSTAPHGSRQLAWLAVGVAGALVAAAGGYAVGQSQDSADDVAPPITLGAPGDAFASGDELGMPGSLSGPGFPDTGEGVGIMPVGLGHIIFTASNLSVDATTSDAWAYDPRAVFSKATSASAAQALGLDGEPRLVGGSWVVGSRDGTGPSLLLMPDGTASLSYWNQLPDSYSCATGVPEDSPGIEPDYDPSTASGGVEPGMLDRRNCDKPSGETLSSVAAIKRLNDLMENMGVDTASYKFDAMDYGMPNAASVGAWQVVDGQQTGVAWSATFIDDEVQSLYGALAPLASLGRYDVVSPADAVARLGDPRFGAGGWGGPMPYMDNLMGSSGQMGALESRLGNNGGTMTEPDSSDDSVISPEPTLPPTMNSGEPFAWPVTAVPITGARLGLAIYTQPDGSAVLLPTYELSAGDESTWSVVAVDEASLNFTG